MMTRTSVLIFVLLSVVNLTVYFFRDHFQYRPYAGYDQLYGFCDDGCSTKWRQFVSAYPETEFKEAKRLADSITRGNVSDYQI